MEAPPIKYTRTSDGYSIAYVTSGVGPAIVYMPHIFQHAQRLWAGSSIAASLRRLSARFQVIQYDSRGQGMSQRGLAADHSMEAYERDLEAVISAAGISRPALLAVDQFGHVAIRYAVSNPDKVAALILYNTSVDGGLSTNDFAKMAESNWDTYLVVTARTLFPAVDTSGIVRYFRAAADQDDQLKFLAAAAQSNVVGVAPLLKTPVLIVSAANRTWPGSEDFGKHLAPLIKGSRLIVVRVTEVDPLQLGVAWPEVETFLDEIGFTTPEAEADQMPDGLSAREIEVLRLIATGKSNPQIAAELVLSINTVQRHVSNILAKTGLANRAEAASYATRHGLV